jgi:hypothetical protein
LMLLMVAIVAMFLWWRSKAFLWTAPCGHGSSQS